MVPGAKVPGTTSRLNLNFRKPKAVSGAWPPDMTDILTSLTQNAPFDLLPPDTYGDLQANTTRFDVDAGVVIFAEGDLLKGLYIIEAGAVDIEAAGSDLVSHKHPGDVIGERGLLRNGKALLTARTVEPTTLLLLPKNLFLQHLNEYPAFSGWFAHAAPAAPMPDQDGLSEGGLTALNVRDLMSISPVTCRHDATVKDAAALMRDHQISSVVVTENDDVVGIVTGRDLTNKVLASGLDPQLPVAKIMTPNPVTIEPGDLGLDAMITLAHHNISHLPVAEGGKIVGLIGKTDLFRKQANTASHMASELVQANSAAEMVAVMARVPRMMSQLVFSGARPSAVTRRITDLTDTITRRLLVLAEEKLGPPPVPYAWLACGSQGRREQTGVSDQDNCLILDDAFEPAHDAYFAQLAAFVSDGLDRCGYVYCPGDMMATNPRWRQPLRVWRDYFQRWIAQPDPEAQMLASVMFDLRVIEGEAALFEGLQSETLEAARKNSIFVAHMVGNALKHTPPLSLFRNLALIRSGEHKDMLDLKHSGVVPVVDLGRVYAIQGAIAEPSTKGRLTSARDSGVISQSGAHDLIDAYDLIAEIRLRHQAEQIRAGEAPDNFMAPGLLSDLERSHLRDAFMVIKAMQSYLGHGRSALE